MCLFRSHDLLDWSTLILSGNKTQHQLSMDTSTYVLLRAKRSMNNSLNSMNHVTSPDTGEGRVIGLDYAPSVLHASTRSHDVMSEHNDVYPGVGLLHFASYFQVRTSS